MRYRGIYLNLAESLTRRRLMEGQLERLNAAHRYRRFEAIQGEAAAERGETTLSAGQLGCWLSHLAVWREAIPASEHLHVLEDDAALTPLLLQVLEQMELEETSWDLLLTDVYFHPPPTPEQFAQLAAARQAFLDRQKISLIDLKQLSFTGTTSYVVNRSCLERLGQLLTGGWRRNQTIDVALQQLVRRGDLRARLIFPFLSTLNSEHAVTTAGMRGPAVQALDAFRQAWFYAAVPEVIRQRTIPCRCQDASEPLLELYLNGLRAVLGTLSQPAQAGESPPNRASDQRESW